MAVIDYSAWDVENKVEYYKRQVNTEVKFGSGNSVQDNTATVNNEIKVNNNRITNTSPDTLDDVSQIKTENYTPSNNQSTITYSSSIQEPTKQDTKTETKTGSKSESKIETKVDSKINEKSGSSKTESKSSKSSSKNDSEGGNTAKVIGYVVGGIVVLILFLLLVKLYRRRKINKYRNRETIRKDTTIRNPNINKVPTISYGNAVPVTD